MLEYLYTDHAPIEQMSDVVGLLTLADEKALSRLVNLCELYISKMVDKACQDRIEKADIDVIGLLNTARVSSLIKQSFALLLCSLNEYFLPCQMTLKSSILTCCKVAKIINS